ncbi:putative 2-oxoglutarate dehydrogenase E1 component DHKTD1, mitochondrial, partial [Cichlidogyrus casuarinus]
MLKSKCISSVILDDVANLSASPLLKSASSADAIFQNLRSVYCGPITIEYAHVSSFEQREWLTEHFESLTDRFPLTQKEAANIAQLLIKGQIFDHFIASKFASVKRYSGEGAESLLPAVQTILRQAALDGVHTAVFGMPHRGRNNLLTTLFNYPVELYFLKMKGQNEFAPGTVATGDTFSHFFTSTDLSLPPLDEFSDSLSVHATMVPNPSHLEANIPVCMGKARSKMLSLRDGDYNESDLETAKNGDKVLCVQIHGDASVTGQGVVAESLAIGACPHFDTGGSIHLIVNNQVGFTTESPRGSSFQYVSDVAKTAGYPVLHVNADHPEAVYRAARLAAQYRHRFRRDVFIDLVCYRRWGHNELDDPTMTQPLMYSHIHGKKTCPDAYLERLQNDKSIPHSLIESNVLQPCKEWSALLHQKLESIDKNFPTQNLTFKGVWSGFDPVSSGIGDGIHVINTGVDPLELVQLGSKTVHVPSWFSIHPTVQ